MNEEAKARVGPQRHRKNNLIFDLIFYYKPTASRHAVSFCSNVQSYMYIQKIIKVHLVVADPNEVN